jgi:ribonuclease BN (tRNA processing enzyme)
MTPDQSWSFGDVTVTPRLVQHPSGDDALALILAADGKTIAYTGDTQWFDDLAPWLSRADLLIAEAYFYEKPIKFHLSYNTLLEKLPQLGPQRTILTHMSQDMLDHLDQVEIEAAHDGMTVRV